MHKTGIYVYNIVMTVSPPVVCVYKNQLYRQDQVWYDDCNSVCRCEDASTGYYRCQERFVITLISHILVDSCKYGSVIALVD